jgi:phage tail-like protein
MTNTSAQGSIPPRVVDTSFGFKGVLPSANAFLFEINGGLGGSGGGAPVQIGAFTQVSGLELRVEPAKYQEGGQNGFEHQFPGRLSWPNIVLRRGIIDSDALFAWVNETSGPGFEKNGRKLTRRSGAITALASDGTRLRAWNLSSVIAIRWKGPQFDLKSSDALEEELEIAHYGFTSKTFSAS